MEKLWLWTMNYINQQLKSRLLSTLSPTIKPFNKMVLKVLYNLWMIRISPTSAHEITKKTSIESQVRLIRRNSVMVFLMLSMGLARIIWLRITNLKTTTLRCRFQEAPTHYKTTWITWMGAVSTVAWAPSTKKVRWPRAIFWVAHLRDCSRTCSVSLRFRRVKIC